MLEFSFLWIRHVNLNNLWYLDKCCIYWDCPSLRRALSFPIHYFVVQHSMHSLFQLILPENPLGKKKEKEDESAWIHSTQTQTVYTKPTSGWIHSQHPHATETVFNEIFIVLSLMVNVFPLSTSIPLLGLKKNQHYFYYLLPFLALVCFFKRWRRFTSSFTSVLASFWSAATMI